MKFQPDTLPGVNVITRTEDACVWVGTTRYASSVLVPWRGDVLAWPPEEPGALLADHFEQMIALAPEVVIYGSGASIRFPKPALMRALIERRIGVETMDTAAACRTYNVLASEGRSVIAALLMSDLSPKVRNL